MKLNTTQLQQILPVSTHTIGRFSEDVTFPTPNKIGRSLYYDESAIYSWLNTRCNPKGNIKHGDKVLDMAGICRLLGRSPAWVWLNITKPGKLTTVDLSATPNSQNPRVYMTERELLDAFGALADLVAA